MMRFIWVTRGRDWGFRFLRTAGYADPLPVYESAFDGVERRGDAFARKDNAVVLRIDDPLGRKDAAGRLIPHEFVIFDDEGWDGFDETRDAVWPLVAQEFAQVWDSSEPPIPRP